MESTEKDPLNKKTLFVFQEDKLHESESMLSHRRSELDRALHLLQQEEKDLAEKKRGFHQEMETLEKQQDVRCHTNL